jgi:ribonuclease-3
VFAEVCFFPRLQQFIINQEWNDPKSKLQQCCLTLRTINGHDPDIPVYKVSPVTDISRIVFFNIFVANAFISPFKE